MIHVDGTREGNEGAPSSGSSLAWWSASTARVPDGNEHDDTSLRYVREVQVPPDFENESTDLAPELIATIEHPELRCDAQQISRSLELIKQRIVDAPARRSTLVGLIEMRRPSGETSIVIVTSARSSGCAPCAQRATAA
jgi:hypothetical protein